jgi:hypothetical protein
MYTVVFVLMMLTVFNFLLKQTFWKITAVGISAAVAAVFAGALWPVAIEQSKIQITGWLANPRLMLDTSVLLTLEVCLQMSYCMLAVHVHNAYPVKKKTLWAYRLLRWIPGILVYPVLFSGLVYLIFAFPGVSFIRIAWGYALAVFILIPVGRWILKRLLPETDLRLELLFLSNALVAILGIVATVNGRTAMEGTDTANWFASLGLILILLAGAFIGLIKSGVRSKL